MPLRFSINQVNHYVLHKQFLSPRSRERGVVAIVSQVGPLRATPTITPYLSLWARCRGFDRAELDNALYKTRTLVRGRTLHGHLYVIPSAHLPAYHQVALRFLSLGMASLDIGSEGIPVEAQGDLIHRVQEVMSVRGPSTLEELYELLPPLSEQLYFAPECPDLGHTKLGARLIPAMCAQGLLVHARVRGGLRSNLYSYATMSSWLPDIDLGSVDDQTALVRIILSYIAAYGPVTVGDIVHWLGDVPRHRVVVALMALNEYVTHIQISGLVGDYVLLETEVEALSQQDIDAEALCLVPARDSLLSAYADSRRFLEPRYRDRVYNASDEPIGTIWANGYVAGVWSLLLRDERIVVHFFEQASPLRMASIGEEAQQLADWLDWSSLDLELGPYPQEPEDADRELETLLASLRPEH